MTTHRLYTNRIVSDDSFGLAMSFYMSAPSGVRALCMAASASGCCVQPIIVHMA
jgi:hypothetical protein